MKNADVITWLNLEKGINITLLNGLEDIVKIRRLNKVIEAIDEAIAAMHERDAIYNVAVNVMVQNAELRQIIEDLKYFAPKSMAEIVQAKIDTFKAENAASDKAEIVTMYYESGMKLRDAISRVKGACCR